MTHKVGFRSYHLTKSYVKTLYLCMSFSIQPQMQEDSIYFFRSVVSEPFDKCFLSQASNVFTHKFVSFAFNFHWLYIYYIFSSAQTQCRTIWVYLNEEKFILRQPKESCSWYQNSWYKIQFNTFDFFLKEVISLLGLRVAGPFIFSKFPHRTMFSLHRQINRF